MTEGNWVRHDMGKSHMVLHCGADSATWEDVRDVPLPEEMGGRYGIVPHQAVIELVQERVSKEFSDTYGDLQWEFALGKNGQRLFAMGALAKSEGQWGPAFALRNSYDRSSRFGFGIGARVFICDNLAISGSDVTYSRVHVGDAWSDIRLQLIGYVAEAQQKYERLSNELRTLQHKPVKVKDGWEMLGTAVGQRVLSITQFSKVLKAWNQDESKYGERTLYRIYNDMTEQLKNAPVNRRMAQQTETHRLALLYARAA